MKSAAGSRKLAAGTWICRSPELTIHVETLTNEAFYYFGKDPGAGGLPVGVSGRVVCLLSGGIDSPVAAWRLMRRGCRVHFVHFHSYPILSRASQEKARELGALLTQLSVPLAALPRPVRRDSAAGRPVGRAAAPGRHLSPPDDAHRRGDRAINNRADALVTGEVVGQVASQTLENLTAINAVATLPVLRPLIGMDKDEITAEAERLGTFPISIIPDQDCCTLFTPKHPATKARMGDVLHAESALPVDEIVARAVAAASVEHFEFPVIK